LDESGTFGVFLPHAARYAMGAHRAAQTNGQQWTSLQRELQSLVEVSMRVTATARATATATSSPDIPTQVVVTEVVTVTKYMLEEDPKGVGKDLHGMLGRLDDLDEWIRSYHEMLERTGWT
jgi:hypothetical protein